MSKHKLLTFLSIPLFIFGLVIGEFIGVFFGKAVLIHLPEFFQHTFFNFPFWTIVTASVFLPLENGGVWSKIYTDRSKLDLAPVSCGLLVGCVSGSVKLKIVLLNALLVI